jgi:hypothetical protein
MEASLIQLIVAIVVVVCYFKFVHPNIDEPWKTIANIVIGIGVIVMLLRFFDFI